MTKLSLALCALALARVALAAVALARGDEAWRAQYLPDDGFYYLQLAKSFVATGSWSVDGGVSVTSGFHPLMAYSLALVFALVQPSDAQFVSYAIALSAGLALLAGCLLWLVASKVGGRLTAVFVVLLLASNNYLLNAVGFMESSWFLLCSAAFFLAWLRAERDAHATARSTLSLVALGFCGSLARTDFLLLPGLLWLGALLVSGRAGAQRFVLRRGAGTFGAILGASAALAHCRITSGQWLQSSAVMKAHWAHVVGRNPLAALGLLVDLLGYPTLAVAGALAVVALASSFKRRRVEYRAELGPVYGGALALPGYVALYSLGSSTQPWYTATLAVPAICLVAAVEANLPWLWDRTRRLSVGFAVAALGTAWLVLRQFSISALPAPWIHHQSFVEAGRSLASERRARIGSWNSGIIGYYQGGRVINLDGLVNNDVYPYAARNELAAYISARKIGYVVEFSRTLREPTRRRKHGHDDPRFLASLEQERVFGKRNAYWGELALYRVTRR